MSHFDFARVVIRLFAVFLFAWAAWLASSYVTMVVMLVPGLNPAGGGFEWMGFVVGGVLSVGVLAAMGVIFWFLSGYVASRVVGSAAGDASPLHIEAHALFSIGCSLIGLWLIMRAIINAANLILMGVTEMGMQYMYPDASGRYAGQIAAVVVQLLLGLYLLLGSRGLVAFVARVRTAGLHPATTAPVEDHPPRSD